MINLPAGTYFIGDPCYAISNEGWERFTANLIELDDMTVISKETCDVTNVWLHSTYFGNGCYFGSDGNEYPVDSGLIGAVPVEDIPADKLKMIVDSKLGSIVEFEYNLNCSYRFSQGTFHFDGGLDSPIITIDTKDSIQYETNDD